MTTVYALGPEWLKPDTILEWLGPWALVGLAVIIFAECGLLLGFFLPGDSLLFTAGLFVADGAIDSPLWAVCALLVGAAVLGNVCGYWIGRSAGPAVFDKPKSRLFKPANVAKTCSSGRPSPCHCPMASAVRGMIARSSGLSTLRHSMPAIGRRKNTSRYRTSGATSAAA